MVLKSNALTMSAGRSRSRRNRADEIDEADGDDGQHQQRAVLEPFTAPLWHAAAAAA